MKRQPDFSSLVPTLHQAKLENLERLAKSLKVAVKRGKRERVQTYRAKLFTAVRLVIEREERESNQGSYPILRDGHVGPAVLEVQRFMRTRPTGRMSTMDTIEVSELQRTWGMPMTGVVDEAFWRMTQKAKYSPHIQPNPWFYCAKCGVPVPDKRDICNICEDL